MNSINPDDLIISNLKTESGREYALNILKNGNYQYMDRDYKFAYIPEDFTGCIHIRTCGNDKLISENAPCLSFTVNKPVYLYVIFADKFPAIPKWLESYERLRKNITRQDSETHTLKGYFSLYRKSFPEGKITLNGCSPESILKRESYVASSATFCMYTLCIMPQG
jgi:hypothetical protein